MVKVTKAIRIFTLASLGFLITFGILVLVCWTSKFAWNKVFHKTTPQTKNGTSKYYGIMANTKRGRNHPLFYGGDEIVPWKAAGHLKGGLGDDDTEEILEFLEPYDPSQNSELIEDFKQTKYYQNLEKKNGKRYAFVNGFHPYNCSNKVLEAFLMEGKEADDGYWDRSQRSEKIVDGFRNLQAIHNAVEKVRITLDARHPGKDVQIEEFYDHSETQDQRFHHLKYTPEVVKRRQARGMHFHVDNQQQPVVKTENDRVHFKMLLAVSLDAYCKGGDLVLLKDGAIKLRKLSGYNPKELLTSRWHHLGKYTRFKAGTGDITFHALDMIHGVMPVQKKKGELRREKVVWYAVFSCIADDTDSELDSDSEPDPERRRRTGGRRLLRQLVPTKQSERSS